jgi:myo-inositol-1(or 4)-monophosphatase
LQGFWIGGMDLAHALELAVDAARAAGNVLRDHTSAQHEVLQLKPRDIKLQADRDAEAIILERLAATGLPILAEESGEVGEISGDGLLWVVDPLDGTQNFSRHLPLCCISIALCRGEEPLLGVIYDFNSEETFSGIPGQGAWLNGVPMRVADTVDRTEAILCTGFPSNPKMPDDLLLDYMRRGQSFKKVRLLGSAALMMAYVACGRVDAYLEIGNYYWDVAAGIALIRAAGGVAYMEDSSRSRWGRQVRCACRDSLLT